MSPIEVTASDAPITVSASGTKVDATVSGGQGPQGPAGPTGPQGPSGASNWTEIVDRPETFPPSAHSHAIADVTDLSDVLAEKVPLSGGAMNENAALTFSTETSNSEVGAWGFGVGLTGETGQYATIEPAAITIVDPSGTTQLAPGGLTMPNYTKLIVGSFDNSTGGQSGISLICAVGYELNWQGGRVRSVMVGGDGTPQTIHFDSPIAVSAAGVTFSDDTTQTTAGATPGDVSAAQSAAEAYAVQRGNHTGSQAISTVDGLQTALDGKQASGSYAATVHTHGISDVTGLQTALNAKATPADVTTAVAAVVNAAPASLDTLKELADALGNDASFASTVTNALAAKAPLASPTFTGTVGGVTKAMVGLGNVDNVADTSKPISTATQTALDGKAALSHTHSAAQITDFTTSSSAAAPVQSVAGRTGAVTLAVADVSGAVASTDSRLTDTRTPTDGSVTDAKITSGGLSTSSLNWAAIAAWAPSTVYAKGDLVSNAGIAYRRSAAGTSGATFNVSNWQQITPSEFVGSQITSGTVPIARLGTGSPSSANFLRGDGTFATAGSTSASDLTSGTLPEARLPNSVILHPFLLAGM